MDLISVIIPTFNREHVLFRAVESVIAQSEKNWELIIVDDGSTDLTAEVVKGYLKNPKIHYYFQKNKGVSSARNYGAARAKGTYLIFLDSDDEFKNDLFRSLLEVDYQENELIFWNLLKKDAKGDTTIWKPTNLGPLYNNIKGTFIPGSVCYKKEIFLLSGGYDEKMTFGENYELAMRVSHIKKLRTLYLNKDLAIQYRNDEERTSNSLDNRLNSYQHLYEKHYYLFRKFPNEYSKMNYFLGYVLEKKGQKKEAQAKYREALISYPLNFKSLFKFLFLKIWN